MLIEEKAFVLLFALNVVAVWWQYSLRKRIWQSHPANYATIGFRESDGAYLDAVRTMYAIPFKMSLSGLPKGIRWEVWANRLYIVLITGSFLVLFVYISFWPRPAP